MSFTTTISLAFICFILTKWYVNGKIWEKLTNIMQSFILTKWYVNEIFSAIATTLVCVLY
ncbi:putative membrane protein [Clostridioides difficile CD212]|nr:putative membrane protein [Clostridioides difficile CD104]EQF66126.1 putative membrane protein [Clostridioides difficile CD206]EQF74084.1 putative membrane protein [Clostridioides difficile CD212]